MYKNIHSLYKRIIYSPNSTQKKHIIRNIMRWLGLIHIHAWWSTKHKVSDDTYTQRTFYNDDILCILTNTVSINTAVYLYWLWSSTTKPYGTCLWDHQQQYNCAISQLIIVKCGRKVMCHKSALFTMADLTITLPGLCQYAYDTLCDLCQSRMLTLGPMNRIT